MDKVVLEYTEKEVFEKPEMKEEAYYAVCVGACPGSTGAMLPGMITSLACHFVAVAL